MGNAMTPVIPMHKMNLMPGNVLIAVNDDQRGQAQNFEGGGDFRSYHYLIQV